MSTQEYGSTNLTVEADKFFNDRIKPNLDTLNTVLKKDSEILKKDSDYFKVEYAPGKSLNSLATEYLGNSFAWQIIADANEIDPTKEIDLKKDIKIPKIDALKKSAEKYIIESPQGKRLIKDVRDSVLNLLGIKDKEVAKKLDECAEKILNFKIDG
jgi:hypothetical protein